ncbi:PEP-CTERM sorting domain-containing protein [Desulfogranum mediterraneum]|uniref:PEP-CTERM sorting domain-containing protein n=1 Tax=Desulfogranum mediterraneum TaxID=160661 RepID=UPI00048CDD96|nr:PEP-CTERM sorting domain-containing protein [Desulfogranum mediterraneum]
MKGFVLKTALVTVAAIALSVGSVMATSIGFVGSYGVSSTQQGGVNVYSIDFMDGSIFKTDFASTDIVNIGDQVKLTTLSFAENSPGVFSFAGDPSANLFQILDSDSTVLFSARLEVEELKITGSVGDFNSELKVNLFDIAINDATNSSPFLQAFLPAGQVNGILNMSMVLDGNITDSGSGGGGVPIFSGTASPVPEPGSTLLFGMGALGFAGMVRRKAAKKN